MKMKKWTFLALLAALALLLTACAAAQAPGATPTLSAPAAASDSPEGSPSAAPDGGDAPQTAAEPVRVAGLNGPTGIGLVKLMADHQQDGAYAFTLDSAPDAIVAKVSSGEADIAAVPTNLAATLYRKTNGGVQMIALNTLGVLSILENGDSVQSVSDLAGKTLYATGQASTPEYVLNYILSANGLTPGEDVQIVYLADHAELAAKMAAGEVALGMLPQPHATSAMMKKPDLRVAVDLTQAWSQVGGGSELTQGCLIARTEWAQAHPEALSAFLDDYKASTEYVNAHVPEAAAWVAQFGIMGTAQAAEKAIPLCNITFVEGEPMKRQVAGFFQVLFDADPKSVGGQMPDDGLYFIR